MTIAFSNSRKFLVSSLAIAAALTSTAYAAGGDTPIPGIDIIIKRESIQSPQEPYSFGDKELKAVNAVKGFERPARIAGYAAQYAHKQAEGAAPKGGWGAVLKEGLIADWNVDEHGGSTAIKVMTLEPKANYIVTIRVHSEEGETLKWSKENGAITLPSTAPSGGNPDVGGVTERAISYGSTRSNRKGIAAPVGCVTVNGAVDANCDGVADAVAAEKRSDRKKARKDKG